MNLRRTSWMRTASLMISALAFASSAMAGGDAISDAKSLYAAASYEAALQALQQTGAQAPTEVLEYRALCLLALGRTADAERTAAELVTSSPTLIPSAEEFPPRFVALVTETRRKLLPTLAKQMFATAREEFHDGGSTQAAAKFEQVLALADDPVVRNDSDAKDLRTLAMGFLDLLRARPVAAVKAASAPVAGPARPPQPATVVQAVPVRQSLPTWVPQVSKTAAADLHGQLKGQLRLVIGVDGRVTSARVLKPTHPSYDVLVLQAARDWLYQPATLNGVPVQSERVLDIVLDVR